MPLNTIPIRPGFNKQITETGAEGQWVDGDFVRFRYGLPEKMGGWEQLTNKTLVGVARDQHVWADLDGRKYSAIGTHKALFVYYSGEFYDITPLDTAITGATFTIASTSSPQTITVNKAGHGLEAGDLFTFTSVSVPTGSGYATTVFTDNTFEVLSNTLDTFTIQVSTAASGVTSATGSATINPYVTVGPTSQTAGYGWGTSTFGGASGLTNSLNGSLNNDTAGTGGSGTSITLNSTANFPASGTIKVGAEFISYTGISSNDLTGITRDVAGTRSAHSSGATVEYYTAWGQTSLTTNVTVDPAS